MKSILLKGFFGHGNLGDDLLLKEALCTYPQNVKLYVTWGKENDEELTYFQKFHAFTPIYGYKDLLKHRYDAIVWSGGGTFPTRNFRLKNLLTTLPYRILAKKIVLNGIGIVEKPMRKWFDCFLQLVDYCTVRDNKSLEYVRVVRKDVVNCGDLYWGNTNSGGANRPL